MIAYKKEWLDNLLKRANIKTAFNEGFLHEDEKIMAEKLYPVGFYTPNYFIRIGLFVLTIIIATFSAGIVLLITLSSANQEIFGSLSILFSLFTYGILELIIKYKKHYKSGVDDALLYLSGICFVVGLNLLTNVSLVVNTGIIFFIALYFLLRFINNIIGIIATITFLMLVYLLVIRAGGFFITSANFLIACFAGAIYFCVKQFYTNYRLKYYQDSLLIIEITALICLYASVNYYIVREQTASSIIYKMTADNKIYFEWVYWIFTISLPFIYIIAGIKRKNRVLLRIGMLLIPAMFFTIRYYHAILAIEQAMIIGGVLLIGLAYGLIMYLKKPKNGFTFKETADNNLFGKVNIEALIIAESTSAANIIDKPAVDDSKPFGGGDFGGGGASSEF